MTLKESPVSKQRTMTSEDENSNYKTDNSG